jgi:anti-sigma B factor antagonist
VDFDDAPAFELRCVPAAHGGPARLVAAGELDLATAPGFRDELRRALAAGPVRLELGGLTYMDSSGVRVLDGVVRDLDREGWILTVAPELRRPVRQVLEMTGMIGVLPFEPAPEERPS